MNKPPHWKLIANYGIINEVKFVRTVSTCQRKLKIFKAVQLEYVKSLIKTSAQSRITYIKINKVENITLNVVLL